MLASDPFDLVPLRISLLVAEARGRPSQAIGSQLAAAHRHGQLLEALLGVHSLEAARLYLLQ